jgi:hypothetical protein
LSGELWRASWSETLSWSSDKTMEDVYSYVEASDSFQNKMQLLEETIGKLYLQTVECVVFGSIPVTGLEASKVYLLR